MNIYRLKLYALFYHRFSVGRATALVLDSGGGTTSAVPVYDGYVLQKGELHTPLAGDVVSAQILEYLRNDVHLDVTPQYKITSKKPVESGQQPQVQLSNRPNTTKSFDDFEIMVSPVCCIYGRLFTLSKRFSFFSASFTNSKNLCAKLQK